MPRSSRPWPGTYRPKPREIHDLIRRADDHPLGTEFLRKGALDAVAATFQVHAFAIEEARRELEREPEPEPRRQL